MVYVVNAVESATHFVQLKLAIAVVKRIPRNAGERLQMEEL